MRLLAIWALLEAIQTCFAANILFLIPMPARSHYNLGDRLSRELVAKGHHVTLISTFKMDNPPKKNLREIIVPSTKEEFGRFVKTENSKEGNFQLRNMNPVMFLLFSSIGEVVVNATMRAPEVQDLLRSNQKFDLVIGECFLTEALLGGFAHRYQAPIVGLATFMPNTWANEMVGNPSNPAYIPEPILPYTNKMTFYERCVNMLYGIVAYVAYYFKQVPSQDHLMKVHFGENLPPLKTLLKKTSLVLVNQHHTLSFPRPYLPNMVEIGGYHVNPPKPLPKDLQTFMDGATDGVILFSMGSNLQSSDFPEEKFQGILRAFSKLKQRVLWKFEKDNVPNLPKNVKISKWLPQTDILVHPKMKLFITHGGILSITEAVLRGVPLVCIPIFGDQPMNAKFLEAHEIGVQLDYTDLSEEPLLAAVNKVLNNPRYAENMKYRSTLLKDVPVPPMELALYWIEYVLRHKGAPHLQSVAQSLEWYQLYLLDVYAFLFFVVFAVLYLVCRLLRCCKSLCCKKKSKTSSAKKNK